MLFNFEGAAFRKWGCSSAGRAPALHAGGQEFDPPHLHHWKWAHSSGGESARLISVRSVVRIHLCPPVFYEDTHPKRTLKIEQRKLRMR